MWGGCEACHRPRRACWISPLAGVPPPPAPTPRPGPLPVQDFIPALHVKPEVRKGYGNRTVFPSDEVPGSVIRHFLAFLSVLPAPLTLLIPGRRGWGAVRTGALERRASLPAREGVLTWSAYWSWSGRRPNPRWPAPGQTLAYIQWRHLT